MNETRYLFKNASGVFNIGPNTHCPCSSGHYRQTHQVIDGADWVGFVNLTDPGDVFQPIPVTSYLKSNGDAYANLAELESAIVDFFFRVIGSGAGISFVTTSDGQYLPYMTDPNDSTKKTRVGVRSGNLVLDITLTATGFDGNESTDGGITGDWVNVTGS